MLIRGRSRVDFGSAPGSGHATLTVACAEVDSDSDIVCTMLRKASDDHSEDEHSLEDIKFTAGSISDAASFVLHGVSGTRRLTGEYWVAWSFEK